MNIPTILVWLLMSLPSSGSSQTGIAAAIVIERFPTQAECERVANWVMVNSTTAQPKGYAPRVGCIQATIIKDSK